MLKDSTIPVKHAHECDGKIFCYSYNAEGYILLEYTMYLCYYSIPSPPLHYHIAIYALLHLLVKPVRNACKSPHYNNFSSTVIYFKSATIDNFSLCIGKITSLYDLGSIVCPILSTSALFALISVIGIQCRKIRILVLKAWCALKKLAITIFTFFASSRCNKVILRNLVIT